MIIKIDIDSTMRAASESSTKARNGTTIIHPSIMTHQASLTDEWIEDIPGGQVVEVDGVTVQRHQYAREDIA